MQASTNLTSPVSLARWAHPIAAPIGHAQGEPVTLGDDRWSDTAHPDFAGSLDQGEPTGLPQSIDDSLPRQSVPGVDCMLGPTLTG
jgi:hypothetical protein